jgi:hypothetical protein
MFLYQSTKCLTPVCRMNWEEEHAFQALQQPSSRIVEEEERSGLDDEELFNSIAGLVDEVTFVRRIRSSHWSTTIGSGLG